MTNEEKIMQILVDLQKEIGEIKQEAIKTNIKIENDVTRRLDSLTMGTY
jgi:hypothetical protein